MGQRATVLANDSLMLLTAVIWGLAITAQRVGMEHVGPLTFNALRYASGFLALLPLLAVRRLRPPAPGSLAAAASPPAASSPAASPAAAPRRDGHVMLGALLTGAVLFAGSSFQQTGLVYTTAGKAGFITGLYVVLVPLAGLLRRQGVGWSAWMGAVLAAIGLFLISVTGSFRVETGDLLVLAGAFCWAGHVQMVGWMSRRIDPIAFSVVQFAVCSVASGAAALLRESISVTGILSAAVPILYAGLLSSAVGFTLQAVAQRRAPPAHAAVLLSLESVFAALGGVVLLGERMGARVVVGCVVMFAGMIVSQVPRLLGAGGRAGEGPATRDGTGRSRASP